MKTKIKLGFAIKAIATAIAVLVLALSSFNSIVANIGKMTYPSQVMIFLNILSLLPIITIVIVSAFPLKSKIGLNIHLFNEVCILIGLIISGVSFAFDFRAEYTMLYGLFSEEMIKALTVVFYAMLLAFHKTGKFRNVVISIGTFLCAFKLIYNYMNNVLYMHQNLSLSVISSVLVIATVVIILCAFSDLDRYSYFSSCKQYPFENQVVYAYRCGKQEFAIIRVTDNIIYIQDLLTGKSMFSALYRYDPIFYGSEEATNKASAFREEFEQQLKIGERFL